MTSDYGLWGTAGELAAWLRARGLNGRLVSVETDYDASADNMPIFRLRRVKGASWEDLWRAMPEARKGDDPSRAAHEVSEFLRSRAGVHFADGEAEPDNW
jgi:hypothetical protein